MMLVDHYPLDRALGRHMQSERFARLVQVMHAYPSTCIFVDIDIAIIMCMIMTIWIVLMITIPLIPQAKDELAIAANVREFLAVNSAQTSNTLSLGQSGVRWHTTNSLGLTLVVTLPPMKKFSIMLTHIRPIWPDSTARRTWFSARNNLRAVLPLCAVGKSSTRTHRSFDFEILVHYIRAVVDRKTQLHSFKECSFKCEIINYDIWKTSSLLNLECNIF